MRSADKGVLPVGSTALERVLGCGGLPRGRVVEVWGPGRSAVAAFAEEACLQAKLRVDRISTMDEVERCLDGNGLVIVDIGKREFLPTQLRRLTARVHYLDACLLILNEEPNPAVKYYASVRISTSKLMCGSGYFVKSVKNKCGPAFISSYLLTEL